MNSGVLSDGTPYTFRGFNRPSSILVTEAFLIENGKIRRVEMVGTSAAYHINSPWWEVSAEINAGCEPGSVCAKHEGCRSAGSPRRLVSTYLAHQGREGKF